jgi:hypothetical protein
MKRLDPFSRFSYGDTISHQRHTNTYAPLNLFREVGDVE